MKFLTQAELDDIKAEAFESGYEQGYGMSNTAFEDGMQTGLDLAALNAKQAAEAEPDLVAVEVTNVQEGPAFTLRSFEKGRATFVDLISGNEVVGEGIALRNPRDPVNEELGFAIAMERAFEDAAIQARTIRNKIQRECGC